MPEIFNRQINSPVEDDGALAPPAGLLAALSIVAVFAWGLAFYGLGFYMLRLNQIRGWSISSVSNVTFVFYSASTVLGFLVTKVVARRGSRVVFGTGAITLGAAMIALPHAEALPALVAVYLLLAVGWSATNAVPISTTVMAWFPHGQRELSIALVGASFGGIALIPSLAALDERFGFTTALTTVGLVEITVVGLLAIFVIKTPPVQRSDSTDRIAWPLIGQPRFWSVSVGLALAIVVQAGFLVHQLSILASVTTSQNAARIVGLTTASALIGRLGPIVIGDRIDPPIVGAGYLVIQAVGLFLLATLDHTVTAMAVSSVLYGFGVGVLITMPPLLTRTAFPEVPYTSAYPVVNLSFQISLATGAPLLAFAHARFGDYQPAMWLLGGADLLAAIIFVLINRKARRPSNPPTLQHTLS